MDNITGFEALILIIFFAFALVGIARPEKLLNLQKNVYSIIGVEYNYSERTITVIRGLMVLILIVVVFALFVLS